MSSIRRQIFGIKEQQINDVVAAIKTITPVISVIREWGKREKEYNEVMEKQKTLSKEIESIRYVLGISYSDGELKESLSTLLAKKESSYEEVTEQVEQLKNICDSYENEVINYQAYVKSFAYVNDDFMLEVVKSRSLVTKEQGLAVVFFLFNNGKGCKVPEIAGNIANFFKGSEQLIFNLSYGSNWNGMLRLLKAGKI